MGFSQAVSGMKASASNLDVISNNIANAQTVGFKASTITFADLYADSKVGLGVRVADVTQDFTDGTITTTDRGLDVAISGNGFFRMQDANGEVYYTRNGQFTKNAEGYITNAEGLLLTGYPAEGIPRVVASGASPVPLRIPTEMMPARASSSGNMAINLDSSSEVPKTAFAPNDVDSYNYATSITTYDSLGGVHNMNLYFVKIEETVPLPAHNIWKVHSIDSNASSEERAASIATPAGYLFFDSNGKLTDTLSEAATEPGPIVLKMSAANGAPEQDFKLSFTNSLQQNTGSSGVTAQTQDGYRAGELSGYYINDDGTITGVYSNQQTQLLGQIVMANFINPEGLISIGNNVWQESVSSGQATVGVGGQMGLGSLTSGAVEASNVDLSEELVNMIVVQRNYQSNAQSIRAQDQILQTLINLR